REAVLRPDFREGVWIFEEGPPRGRDSAPVAALGVLGGGADQGMRLEPCPRVRQTCQHGVKVGRRGLVVAAPLLESLDKVVEVRLRAQGPEQLQTEVWEWQISNVVIGQAHVARLRPNVSLRGCVGRYAASA